VHDGPQSLHRDINSGSLWRGFFFHGSLLPVCFLEQELNVALGMEIKSILGDETFHLDDCCIYYMINCRMQSRPSLRAIIDLYCF
jgi:hypothetical protein